jgi:hypothetical protein
VPVVTSHHVYEEDFMTVIIGIDPHKATHMAVAIDGGERPIGRLEVVADRCQSDRLLAWAAPFGNERTWAIESADGLGKLLSQQLLAAGEHVVDVPPTLSARVRLLGSAKAAKNDDNDALSTAIAGLRHSRLRVVRRDDHTTMLRLLVRRYEDLVALRTQAACRLHAMLQELVEGGAGRRIRADRAASVLRRVRPDDPVTATRKHLASELLGDIRRLDSRARSDQEPDQQRRHGAGNRSGRAARCRAGRRSIDPRARW